MLNHIDIMGRLTRDPELRYTPQQTPVVTFAIACDRDFADKATGDRATDFIDCVAWRSTAEFVSKYFQKGSMACVSGRLQIRDWTDKDGNKRRSSEILADSVYFGDAKRRNDDLPSHVPPAPSNTVNASGFSEVDDSYGGELPF